ncbi:S1 family peptidase [Candidatus Nucleicultrix amoebiphila]|uniref:Serine protease n=1 Tax=Candidatus Nucleicultrix amoebiphila FS5 TaxID=1414854 RepID=A0A1W6N4S1_9PROT|nr:serine protease [Candidatus Nucleicultrix amoebiphila]ARN84781.1 hypothetical protein GQ61_05165 [Candidatus Nucleicultrix amoebiphila FS5]
MITSNVLHRVFNILCGDQIGTCFTIDVDDRQYVITAKHLLEKWDGSSSMKIFHENFWKDIQLTLVGHCNGDIDISILKAEIQLSPNFLLEASSANMGYGQDVYFLGFPYGMQGNIGKLNRDFPLPFVKKAIVSCMQFLEDGTQIFYLDGHNNPGFSGGPIIFKEYNKSDFKVASVISGYKSTEESIFQGENEVPLVYKYNTGIIISYGIKHAVDIITSNPIGYKLTS